MQVRAAIQSRELALESFLGMAHPCGKGGEWHFPTFDGGIRGGQVIGITSADITAVTDRPIAVPDLIATVCQGLGDLPIVFCQKRRFANRQLRKNILLRACRANIGEGVFEGIESRAKN